jgi:ectoine hydroxylase-related dioxygenase (phytanoyl-CoA dioxygenase family)
MQKDAEARYGNNQKTVPWETPDLGAFDPAALPDYRADPVDVETYRRDGVVLLRGAFTDWVEPLRAGLERNLADPLSYCFPCESTKEGEAGRFFDSYCNWPRIPEYLAFVTQSSAAAMAGRFMGSERAQLFHEHAFLKEPGTLHATPWHQDLPYYCCDGQQTVSIYIALDHAPEEVAVRFAKGTHKGALYRPRDFLEGRDFDGFSAVMEAVPDVENKPGDYDIAAWELEPGDTILFDFRTLHGTTSAELKARRRAFSTRWLGDDVVYCERPGETSPPFPDIGLKPGDRMREDWFPVLWRRG